MARPYMLPAIYGRPHANVSHAALVNVQRHPAVIVAEFVERSGESRKRRPRKETDQSVAL
jgi:hypothetical protein